MPDLNVQVTVERLELGLPDLELQTEDVCDVVRLGPGDISWRRSEVTSPYAAGAYPTAIVREQAELRLVVRVKGPDLLTMDQRLEELVGAFSQFTYELETYIELAIHRYRCYSANIVMGEGGIYNSAMYRQFHQEVELLIPRDPIPLVGVI